MQSNKKQKNNSPNYRLKTLQNPYICGKDHRQPTTNSQYRSRIDDALRKKLDVSQKKGRIQTLPNQEFAPRGGNLNKSTKLLPIKQAKIRTKDSRVREKMFPSPQDEKAIKLKVFMNSKDMLIDHWKRQQAKQKEEYLNRLKLAEISPDSPNKFTKKKELKRSLKNIHEKQPKLKSKDKIQKMSGSTLILPKVPKISPNMTIQQLQAQIQKYYIENMIELMQHNKKNLITNKKELAKKIKHQQKEHLMQAKNQIAKAIQQDLRRHQEVRNQEKMDQYRRELEEELQIELYSGRAQQLHEQRLHQNLPNVTRNQSIRDDSGLYQNPPLITRTQNKRDASTLYEDLAIVSKYQKFQGNKQVVNMNKKDEATVYQDPQTLIKNNKKDISTIYEDPTLIHHHEEGKKQKQNQDLAIGKDEEVNPERSSKIKKKEEKSKSMTELNRFRKLSKTVVDAPSNAQKLKISKLVSKQESETRNDQQL